MAHGNPVRVVGPNDGAWLSWLGHPACLLAEGEHTGGNYAVSRGTLPPGSRVVAHRHAFVEGFYVIRGELTIFEGERPTVVGAGGFALVTPGSAHHLANLGTLDVEMLVFAAPSGFDQFQRQAGRVVEGPAGPFAPPTAEDLGRLRSLAPGFGIDLDPPADAPSRVDVKQAGEGMALAVVGDLYTILAFGEDTEGRLGLWHAVVPPGGGPPPHIQSRENEGFYVLDGVVTFTAEGARVEAGPGTFLNVPPGAVHSFKNESDRPATMLIWSAPAGLERLMKETGIPVTDRSAPIPPPSPEGIRKLLDLAAQFGVTVVLPEGSGEAHP